MDSKAQLKDALVGMMRGQITTTLTLAKVLSVDENAATCEVEDEQGITLYEVRLSSQAGVIGLLLVPVVNSYVLVGDIGNSGTAYAVLQYSELERVKVVTDNTILEVAADGVDVSRNGVDLKTILSDLVTAIKLITVTTPSGNSGTPLNFASFDAVQTKINQLLK